MEIHWSAEGSGPPLVLVDPILVDRTLSPNASLAAELRETFRVIRYDRRGKGESATRLDPTLDTEVDDLRSVLAAASPGEPPAVFGFSSGGSLALLAASRGVPMRALVVLEPPSRIPDVDAVVARTLTAVEEGRPADAVRALFAYQGMPAEVVDQMGEMIERLAVYAPTIPVDLRIAERLTVPTLSRVTADVLVLASSSSPPQLIEFSRFAAENTGSGEPLLLDGDWHGIPDDVLAREVARFLAPPDA
ncbi:alpha/beta hydrolase fold [Actinomycetales bacterium JB111]|nr:alpha/beta hydrolase fold [Actinomycetales bacterium JB111]